MNVLVVVAILVIVIGLLTALKAKTPSRDREISFVSRESLFSPAERSFLGVLEQALDGSYRVFGKVRLGDLVKPARGASNSKRTSGLNKINQKHVDFLVCSATDLAIVGVIELDDQSHGRKDRAGRDVFVDSVLSGAGIPIARLSAKRGYQVQEVRTLMGETFKLAVPPSTSATPVTHQQASEPAQSAVVPQQKETAPICQKCGAGMVRRQAKNGPHAGKFFWACSAFPKCRQVVAITEG